MRPSISRILAGSAFREIPYLSRDMNSFRRLSGEPLATIVPWFIIITLSHISSISGSMWLLIITLIFPRSEFMRARIARIWWGSRPIVGSSIIITSGRDNIASAIPTLWRKPLDRLPIILFEALRSSWQISIDSSTLALISERGTPFIPARKVRYSRTLRSSGSGLFSGIKPICLRAASGFIATLSPHMLTLPEVAGISPDIMRIVVLFPAPLGPRNPTTSPLPMRNDTLSIAFTPP